MRTTTTATTRPMARTVPAAFLLIVCSALTGCGGSTATPQPAAPASTPSTPIPTSGSQLTIAFDDGVGQTVRWQLTCDPAGGTHPDPAAACAALDKSGATALPAVGPDVMCAQHMGGPQSAVITGTWRGKAINSSLNLRNSCEIARWIALKGLLPMGGS